MSKPNGIVVQSVARALGVFDCFIDKSAELGISQIAEKMGINKSTAYGLVNTLVVNGFLHQNLENKKYRLGLRLFELGCLVNKRMDIRAEARYALTLLSSKFSTTAHLVCNYSGEVLYIDKVDPRESMVVFSYVGKRVPLYCTGVGKVILAHMPYDFISNYLEDNDFIKRTEYTITDKKKLIHELEKVRQNGYSVDNEEIELGLRCVAAPIFDYNKSPIAAISLSFPSGRLKAIQIDSVAESIIKEARLVSKQMGSID